MTLTEWIKANNSSDADLARAVGVSRPYITRIRARARQPSLKVAVKLSEVTSLPVDTFLNSRAA